MGVNKFRVLVDWVRIPSEDFEVVNPELRVTVDVDEGSTQAKGAQQNAQK